MRKPHQGSASRWACTAAAAPWTPSFRKDALGADAPWERAAAELNRHGDGRIWTADSVTTALDQFILRRNRIAHSGDRNEKGRLSGIRRPYVLENTNLILNVGLAVLYEVDRRIA